MLCCIYGMVIDIYSVSVFVVCGQNMKVCYNFIRKLVNVLNLLKLENIM